MRTLPVTALLLAALAAGCAGRRAPGAPVAPAPPAPAAPAVPAPAAPAAPAPAAPARAALPRCVAPPTALRPGQVEVQVFFWCDGRLRQVYRQVPAGADLLAAALAEHMKGPTARERALGFGSWFSGETAGMLHSATVTGGGRAVADFADLRTVIPNASTSAGSAELLGELGKTVFQFPQVLEAEYRLDGKCETFWDWLQVGGCPAVPGERYRSGLLPIEAPEPRRWPPGPAAGHVPVPPDQGDWEATGEDPQEVARRFVLRGQPCDCRSVTVHTDPAGRRHLNLTVRLEGLKDDSVQAMEYALTLQKVQGRWQVDAATFKTECARGSGSRGLCL